MCAAADPLILGLLGALGSQLPFQGGMWKERFAGDGQNILLEINGVPLKHGARRSDCLGF